MFVRRRRLLGLLVTGLLALNAAAGASALAGAAPDTLTATATIDTDPDWRYYPENETVRDGPDGPDVNVATYDFERFARWDCDDVAMDRLLHYVETRTYGSLWLHGVGSGGGSVTVYYDENLDREWVDERLPERVVTTVTLFGRTHTCTVPVEAEATAPAVLL